MNEKFLEEAKRIPAAYVPFSGEATLSKLVGKIKVPVWCETCGKRPPIKTGDDGKWECHHCAAGLPDPYIKPKTPGRNEKCSCGSGKKYKYCCLRKTNESCNQDGSDNQ